MASTSSVTSAIWRSVTTLALVAGFLAPVWISPEAAAQSSLPATAEAVPESTVIFHTMNLDRNGAQWQQTEALLARVGVPDLLALWEDEIQEAGADMGDVTEADLDALLGGEMAIAVSPLAVERFATKHMAMMQHEGEPQLDTVGATPTSASADNAAGVVGILEPGDLDAAWDYVQRQFTDLAAQRDVSVEESTYGDADVLWVAPGEDAEHAGRDHGGEMDEWMDGHAMHGRSGIAAARAGDFIVAGKSEADIETTVDVIAGTTDSLANSPEMQAVAAELPAEALTFTYLDGQGIIEALGPEFTAQFQSSMPEMPIEALGSQTGFAISADDPGFRFDTIMIPAAGAALAAFVPDNDPAVAMAAAQAPAGTFVFQAGRLPETTFLGAPYALAQAVNAGAGENAYGDDEMMALPTPEEMEQEIATAAATLGFDPRTDLFQLLGDEFIAFSSFPSLDLETFGIDAVAAVSTTDAGALAETVRKLAAWIERSEPETDVSVRRIGSDTVYVVSGGELEGAPGIEFGVVEDQAVVGIGGGIEELLTEPADSLADDAQFQTVLGLLPSEYNQVGYVDVGQMIQPLVMLMGLMGGMDALAPADADLACADYETQELAQAALESDPTTNANLDLDADGQACEDAFAMTEAPAAIGGGLENIRALGAVSFKRGDMAGSSAILYIADGG